MIDSCRGCQEGFHCGWDAATDVDKEDMAMPFELWRQDDNGNRFQVGTFADRSAAEQRLAELARSPHRQTYWVSEGSPEQTGET